jgi:hypothetical protein
MSGWPCREGAPYLGSLLADRQHGMPALGIPRGTRFFHRSVRVVRPLVVFWLDNSEVPLNQHAMDVDTAETLAGVVRLIRQAAVLAWAAADRAAAGSAAQLFALGVDLAADQARHLSRTAPTSTGRCQSVTNRPAC